MENKKDIKKIFKRIGKISAVSFLVVFSMIFYFTFVTQEEEIPSLLGIFFVLSIIAFMICILIAMILEFTENIGKNTVYPVWNGLMIVVCWLVIVAIDCFGHKPDVDWLGRLWTAVGIVAVSRAVKYMWSKGI